MLGTWLYTLSTCHDVTKAQSVLSASSDMCYLSSQHSSASTNLSLDDFHFYLTVCPERLLHLCWHLIISSPSWKIFLTEGKLLPLLSSFSSPPRLSVSLIQIYAEIHLKTQYIHVVGIKGFVGRLLKWLMGLILTQNGMCSDASSHSVRATVAFYFNGGISMDEADWEFINEGTYSASVKKH